MDIKIFRTFIILMLVMALMPAGVSRAYAQEYANTPVSISKEKVRINGQVCYSHVVLERQTLFSISKAYNVSIDEIYRFNPTIKETGLVKNSIIIIPVAEEETVVKAAEEVKEAAAAPKEQAKEQTKE